MALVLLLDSPSGLVAQEPRYGDVRPTRTELLRVAEALAEAAPALSRIWPDFWPEDQSFLLLSPHDGMLLVASWRPPAEYIPLPAAAAPSILQGRAYTREGGLPGFRSGDFPGTYDIDGHRVYALPPMGSTLLNRLAFYVHEAFHFYQRQRPGGWGEVPYDSITGLSPVKALRDPAVVENPAFRRGVEREDNVLWQVVTETEPARLRPLLERYLHSRMERLDGHSDVVAIERRFERREGTAEYVGCRAAILATRRSSEDLRACLTDNLGEEQPGDPVLQFLRWRLYSTGAILTLVLDRLQVPGWRQAVAAGEALDSILARAVTAAPSN